MSKIPPKGGGTVAKFAKDLIYIALLFHGASEKWGRIPEP